MRRSKTIAVILVLALWPALNRPVAADMVSPYTLGYLDMQRFWQGQLPLVSGEQIVRIALLDDNLYALTDGNRAYAVHAHTGVLRWSRAVVDPELTVRGPSHADQFVFFTTPGGVRVLNRSTGEPAGEPRRLRGVVVEVIHDTVEVNIGSLHGVRLGNVLQIHYPGPSSEVSGPGFAQLRITSIQPRRSKGRLAQLKAVRRPRSGDIVAAEVVLPLASVKLPFAASSAAIADNEWIYVGAANQRFYCLNILSGFERWQLRTPRTVAATPVLHGDDLYFAGQDGRVVSCTKKNRVKNWTFQTEGPIFADPLVTDQLVYIASSDRSLYCLDRRTGIPRWRRRFDNPLDQTPTLSDGRVYLSVPQTGLVVLDAAGGKELWRRPVGGEFLMQLGSNAYLWSGSNGIGRIINVVDVKTGKS
ncbi:MAG: PQQ-binding-like beta-propeller repeat protein, partial [Planctomycetota bacterium]|nr:PQQ-binding-like beta-propeller repeat protein [Planctomycetota bacterium]